MKGGPHIPYCIKTRLHLEPHRIERDRLKHSSRCGEGLAFGNHGKFICSAHHANNMKRLIVPYRRYNFPECIGSNAIGYRDFSTMHNILAKYSVNGGASKKSKVMGHI